ncbi:NAD-P-binding protein [Obba rivulosa]|uniref:3-oxoacyl-[acyl-carrier-protein] reductase n=1 Tax=Obba rivulosa TaxID=1052685 RepID=A0A8E2AVD2_9APHY|nr:NAD-P-binding protein [Obba rivulosa]
MSSTRVALVSGAAQGLGLAIALRLAEDGLDVAVNDIASKSEELKKVVADIEAKGRRSIAVTADVSSEEEVKAMVEKVAKELGGLDVMVANAGVGSIKPLVETTAEEFDRVMAINARGVMLQYKYAALQMVQQGRGGRIIGACSSAGKRANLGLCAYSAAKFAVRGLTQNAAQELAPYGITVNAYAPAVIATPMTMHPDDAVNGGPGSTAMGLFGFPPGTPAIGIEAVTSLVSYFISPAAAHLSGQSIALDAGRTFD